MEGVVRGPCGEKLGRALDVEAEEARLPDGSPVPGVTIRWLIAERDGAPTFAVRLFEVAPGAVIPWHRHPWEHGIYVLEGSMTIRIEGREYRVEAGDFIYIPPNAGHDYRAGEAGARFLCVIPLRPSVPRDWEPPCRRGGGAESP